MDGVEAAPVVGIGEDDLDGAGAPGGDDVVEAGGGDVGGQGGIDAFGEQAVADFGHAIHAGGRVFQVAAAGELLAQAAADVEGRFNRPGAVGVDAEGVPGAEFLAEEADGFDFLVRGKDAAFEFDFLEAVLADHLVALADQGFGGKALAVLIIASVGTEAAAARVFVEEVSGEGGGGAGSAAEEVADGLVEGFADDVEAGGFDGGEGAGAGITGIFAGDEPGLGAVAGGVGFTPALPEEGVELEGVHAEDKGFDGFQGGEGAFTAVGFADAGEAVVGGKDEDGAEGVGRMAAVGAAERRVSRRDGVGGEGGEARG